MDKLKQLLDITFGKKISKELYNPKLKSPKETFGYARGEVYKYEELMTLKDGDMVHLEYLEDGETCEDDFGKLSTNNNDKEEWCINGWPIPISDLKPGQLIENCDNSDHTFTIRKAIYDGETDHDRMVQLKQIASYVIDEIQELIIKDRRTKDKIEKKQLKVCLKELNKVLIKVMGC